MSRPPRRPSCPPGWATATAPINPKISVVAIYDYPFAKYGLPPGSSTIGKGISNAGEIVGYVQFGAGQQGFIRNADGTFSPPLIHPADTTGLTTFASGVNMTGTIAEGHSILNGFVLDNGKYKNSANEQFYGINDLGEMCGSFQRVESDPCDSRIDRLRRTENDVLLRQERPGKASVTTAEAINIFGDVAGSFTIDSKVYNGFFRMRAARSAWSSIPMCPRCSCTASTTLAGSAAITLTHRVWNTPLC